MMIMPATSSFSNETPHIESSSSMSSFMSGLLKERAIQYAIPNSNWNINIVDDNARPKHIDKRKILMMQQRKTDSVSRDMRWGGGATMKSSASDLSLSSRMASHGSSRDTRPSLKSSSSDISLLVSSRTTRDSRGAPSSSRPSHRTSSSRSNQDLKQQEKKKKKKKGKEDQIGGGGCRFSTITRSNSISLPPMPSGGLRRAAASDTMLLKMPVRKKSPRVVKPSRYSASEVLLEANANNANATWGTTTPSTAGNFAVSRSDLLVELPKIDLGLEYSSPSLSPSSGSMHSMEKKSSSSSRTKKESSSSRSSSSKDKSMKKKKSSSSSSIRKRSTSSDDLKKRASLLGLDIN